MLRHIGIGELGEILGCKGSAWTSRQWHLLAPRLRVVVHPSLRWMNQTAAAQTSDDSPKRLPGTPAPGRGPTIGEEFDAMQYHGRGTRKIKSRVLHSILKRLSSEKELKYAFLGMELFKKQGIKLTTEAGGLFIKGCCKAGSPQAAVNALGQAEKYGLDEKHVIGPNRFNFLLGHLYNTGDEESYRRAVADARSRGQVLNEQSHFLINKFEAEVKARAEAEEAKREAEEAKQEAEEAKQEDDPVEEEAEATSDHPQQSDNDQVKRKP